jgi:hypothetical protein
VSGHEFIRAENGKKQCGLQALRICSTYLYKQNEPAAKAGFLFSLSARLKAVP